MNEEEQTTEQRKSLLSQRFDTRSAEPTGRKRGRPPAKVYRKNASFYLQPKVLAELTQAYHELNAGLPEEQKLDKASFREIMLRYSIANLSKIRAQLRG